MANNRLYLYCNECNRHQYLAKSFGGDWSTSPHPHDSMGDLLVDFLDDHFSCGDNAYSKTVELRWEIAKPKQVLPDDSMQKTEPLWKSDADDATFLQINASDQEMMEARKKLIERRINIENGAKPKGDA